MGPRTLREDVHAILGSTGDKRGKNNTGDRYGRTYTHQKSRNCYHFEGAERWMTAFERIMIHVDEGRTDARR